MSIRLTPGPAKDIIWKSRQQIADDDRVLFQKFGELYKHFIEAGQSIDEARENSCMYLTFPYIRSLTILDYGELRFIMDEIYDIIISYEAQGN